METSQNDNKTTYLEIDGSILEGGGQILRISISLSFLLNIPIRINNIRAKRDNPGLQKQHLTCSQFILQTFNAESSSSGLSIDSKSITIIPSALQMQSNQIIKCIVSSAGSIGLMIQQILPCMLFTSVSNTKEPQQYTIYFEGGTLCKYCPTIYYLNDVLFPILSNHMNINSSCELIRNGLYPRGGGKVNLYINQQPDNSIHPIQLLSKGKLNRVIIRICHTDNFRFHIEDVCKSIIKETKSIIRNEYIDTGNNDEFDYDKIVSFEHIDLGSSSYTFLYQGIFIYEHTRIKSEYLYSEKKWKDITKNSIVNGCVSVMEKAVENYDVCLDEHTVDHLIIFMALAKGESTIRVGEISMHTQTAIEIIKQFIPNISITITEQNENKKFKTNIINIKGIGYSFNNNNNK